MFQTTLTADMGAGDLIISVADNTDAPTTYPWRAFIGSDGDADQECLYVTGGVAEGLDWDVSRAKEGSDAHPHATGAAVRFKPSGDGTTIRADDLTFDHAIVRTTNQGEIVATANDALGVMGSKLFLNGDGEVTLEGLAGTAAFTIALDGTAGFSNAITTIEIDPAGLIDVGGVISVDATAFTAAINGAAQSLTFGLANLVLTGLPTSDPAVAGALWNDSGTVKISI